VRAAGGALAEADLDQINLSARVHDEEQIRVPRVGEPATTPTALAPAAPPPAAAPPAAAAPAVPAPASININSADAATLATLPGIGPVLAGRIIAYRTAHGPFAQPEDVKRVSGIGDAIFEKIRPYITTGR
jgi:competence protein ComEA